MSRVIQLGQKWTIGTQIGSGAFGRVFEAAAEDGTAGVAKFITKAPGADRDLLSENLPGVRNVVPIIDKGDDGDSLVIVMPRAEKSLRDHLRENGPALLLDDAMAILTDVAQSLEDLASRVVHRDLKPENVLLLGSHWCLADFGIARYADASTGTLTWKGAMTRAYAAPEVWLDEHATSAADIYSFGVMAYEALTGRLPFEGPDFRAQHLTQDPPAPALPATLASIVLECLYKAPGSRPTAANVARRLPGALAPASGALARLQEANQSVVVAQSKAAAAESAAKQEAQRRVGLFTAASASLRAVVDLLAERILEGAPAANFVRQQQLLLTVELSKATLAVTLPKAVTPEPWSRPGIAVDVIACATIRIRIPRNRNGYVGRSHSLWFCDAREPSVYRWFETAFMYNAAMPMVNEEAPSAFDPGPDASQALGSGIGLFSLAWPPTPLDQGDYEDFLEHWINWFAAAAQGELDYPLGMPERSGPGFRG